MDDNLATGSNPSSPDGFAFLNHLSTTAHNILHPTADEKPLARQKRKRTSPEDQAILEAAYRHDSKPDKAARLELVKQVALGEKEVQIWFQNRRQSSRRRSRPLFPYEIAQYHMSRGGAQPRSPIPDFASPEPEQRLSERSDQEVEYPGRERQAIRHSSNDSLQDPNPRSACESVADVPTFARQPDSDLRPGPQSSDVPSTDTRAPAHIAMGYLANRRSVPSLRQMYSESPIYKQPANAKSETKLKKSASFVRLSMNADGKAEIITKDASSPSPPRPYSTMPLPDNLESDQKIPALSFSAAKALKRSSSGRSRDSRSWEFWCDKEARSELENAAERDASGSAAGAIGLLRTASGRTVLGAVPSKRNSQFLRQISAAKRSKFGHDMLTLKRSSTGPKLGAQRLPKIKRSGSVATVYGKGNDSDKENWSPGPDDVSDTPGLEQHQSTDKQRTKSPRQPHTGRGHARRSSINLTTFDKDGISNIDPENDAELSEFMNSGRQKSASVSEDDDLDCVQGLLSLSQGNWR